MDKDIEYKQARTQAAHEAARERMAKDKAYWQGRPWVAWDEGWRRADPE